MGLKSILGFWEFQVGEPPTDDRSRSCLGSWVREYGPLVLERAIEKNAERHDLETSADVFAAVELTLAFWRRRGWIATTADAQKKGRAA